MAKVQKPFRFDDQMLIQIDLYARVFNMSHNAFVTQAVFDRVKRAASEEAVDWRFYTRHARVLGGLECAMFTIEGLEWDEAEGARRRFVLEHAPFFYENPGDPDEKKIPDHVRTPQLWSKLETYMKLWGPGKDAYAAGKAMQETLRAVGIKPPVWGENESEGERAGENRGRRKVRGADPGSSAER